VKPINDVDQENINLSNNQQEARDHVHSGDAEDVPQEEEERPPTGLAEGVAVDGGEDVRVLVEELHDLLEAPEAAGEDAEDVHGDLVAGLLRFVLDVSENCSNGLDDCDDE
jgi:hypothetical protein